MVVFEGGSEGGSHENLPALPAPHAVPGNVSGENQQLAIEDAPLLAIENGPVASEAVEAQGCRTQCRTKWGKPRTSAQLQWNQFQLISQPRRAACHRDPP